MLTREAGPDHQNLADVIILPVCKGGRITKAVLHPRAPRFWNPKIHLYCRTGKEIHLYSEKSPPAGNFLRFGESKTRRNKVQNAFAEPVFVFFGRCAGHNVYGKSFNVTKNINYSSLYFFVFEHLKVTVCDVLQERNVPSTIHATAGIITIYVKSRLQVRTR